MIDIQGRNRISGKPSIITEKKPVYGLNYYGIVTVHKPKADIIFHFLKEALRAGSGKSSHRGLDGYKKDVWLYRNKFSERRGFIEGEEKIYYKGKLVYIQVYHGGAVGDLRSYKEWLRNLLPASVLKRKAKLYPA